jgi:hypothetical protein
MAERLVSRAQIKNNYAMKYTLRCCNPLCHEIAVWVSDDGQRIWCAEHVPKNGKEAWSWE